MKPMLAGTPETLTTLKYPVLASGKYDGIRCLIVDGQPKTRKLLDVPNRHVRRILREANLPALDGELIVKGTFQDVTSAIMSEDGTPDFEFHVFDTFLDPSQPFETRIKAVAGFVEAAGLPWLKVVEHVVVRSPEELVAYEEFMVDEKGFEGVMLRSPQGPYKMGRSTEREAYLLKVKRFTQEEAEVVGFEELETNLNAATTDNLGHTKRSTAKAGKKGAGVLGALRVRSKLHESEFKVGTGFDAAQRAKFWAERESLVGRTVTFKYNKAGMKDVPRFPVFIGFRDPRDMS